MTEFDNSPDKRGEDRRNRRDQNKDFGMMGREGGKNSHIWVGAFILLIGVAALFKASNPDIPGWFFSWKMMLIAIGVFIGLRHGFRGIAWFVLILVGGVFLINDIYPELTFRRYLWPIALIAVGAFFILRPRRSCIGQDGEKKSSDFTDPLLNPEATYTKDDYIDSTSIFGGSKKNIISKNFKGGDLVNIFGGTDLDLMQADFKGTAVIEVTTIFGGTKLIVPSNWAIKSDAVIIFGGIEDKRKMMAVTEDSGKTLLLKGTVIFGGIDIKSY
jgi:predicted membrane protein